MWWWTREDVSREDVSVSRAGLRRASTKQASSKQCAPSPKAFRFGECREGNDSEGATFMPRWIDLIHPLDGFLCLIKPTYLPTYL